MGGYYELRKFIEIPADSFKYDQKDALIDIYIQRKGCIHLGIKFREPKEKNYGWKVEGFECKVMELEMIEGIPAEKWRKFKFDFSKEIKIKVRKCHKKSESSDSVDSDHEFSEEKLRKKAFKLYDEVRKVLKESELKKNPFVEEWCHKDEKDKEEINSLELFLVTKFKEKSKGKELGTIKVSRLINVEKNAHYFETECLEGTKKSIIVEKTKEWNGVNMSYPWLLNSILENCVKSEIYVKPNM